MKNNRGSGFVGGLIIACIIIIVVLGILYFAKQVIVSKPTSDVATSTVVASASSTVAVVAEDVGIKDIDNGTYNVWGRWVSMVNGRFQKGVSPAKDKDYINSSVSFYDIGDINGDKHDDALVQTATSIGNNY